jgi:pilus assembly protein CpaB
MGKLKAIVPFVLAVVLALVASAAIYRWLQKKTAVTLPTLITEDKVDVALAVADLPWGTKLTPEMVKTVPFPKQLLPHGYYANSKACEGRVLVAPLKQNEPIIESKLAPISITMGGVGAVVTPGKRAIAVAGDKVLGLSGFIQPGNRVDVLVSLKQSEKDKEQITKVVLEDILVLASGTQVQNSADGKPAPVDVFTLEVTPVEGERLALAATQGRLHFALRNITDREVVYTMGATVSDTLDAYRPRMQLVKEPVVTSPVEVKDLPRRSFEVQTIKGSKVGKQVF